MNANAVLDICLQAMIVAAKLSAPVLVTALPIVDSIRAIGLLDNYHLLYGVRGDLLRKLERHTEANLDFRKAAELTRNEREKAYLLGRAAEVAA